MTKEQIENIKPGIELDVLIAEHVMGWKVVTEDDEQPDAVPYLVSPPIYGYSLVFYPSVEKEFPDSYPSTIMSPYSTEIKAAWEIVEKIAETHHWEIKSPFYFGYKWFVGMSPHNCTGWNGRPDFQASAETAPLAICRAALLWKFSQESK